MPANIWSPSDGECSRDEKGGYLCVKEPHFYKQEKCGFVNCLQQGA